MRDYTKLYTNGAWVAPLVGHTVDVINPAIETPAGTITYATAETVWAIGPYV
ncbi:acyl-CoA reductase-like NAD-dependent aldehyde dehydrogenase [Bradyrhizobium sp. USDA 4341]